MQSLLTNPTLPYCGDCHYLGNKGVHIPFFYKWKVSRQLEITWKTKEFLISTRFQILVKVCAITSTISKAADQQLEIKVNGDKTVTVDELKAAGYNVEFLFNFTATADEKATGVVNATNKADFKYAVKVTKDDAVFTSEWTDVKVIDATAAVEVTEVGLQSGSEAWNLDYITTTDAAVSLAATKAVNALGQSENVTLPAVEKVTSSDVTVAYYNNGVIKALNPGNVTFTVKFVGLEKTVSVPVVVKAGQEATSIAEAGQTVKVKAGEATDVEFTVNDQYAQKLRTDATLTVKVIDKDNNETSSTVTATAGKATISDFNKAEGDYTVKVLSGDAEIGSFTVKAVDLASATVDKYELTVADKAQIDLKGKLSTPPAADLTVSINAFADEVKLAGQDLTNAVTGLKLETSDKDIVAVPADALTAASFTVSGGTKTGVATVSLVKVEGDFKTTLASINVEVINTTPQITALALQEGKTKVEFSGEAITADDVVAALTAGKDEEDKEILTADKIETVTFVESDAKVIVKIKAIYGGKTFVFDAAKVEADDTTQPPAGGDDTTQPPAGGDDVTQPPAGEEQPIVSDTVDWSNGVVTLTFTAGNEAVAGTFEIVAEGTTATVGTVTKDSAAGTVALPIDQPVDGNVVKFTVTKDSSAHTYTLTFDEAAGAWTLAEVTPQA